MIRVVIGGGPRTGKTTLGGELAGALDAFIHSTDEVMHLGWSEASAAAAEWLTQDGDGWMVVEGVASVRAVRKWMAANPGVPPCEVFVWLETPKVPEDKDGQVRMAKGARTVLDGILPELRALGVEILFESAVGIDRLRELILNAAGALDAETAGDA